MTELGSPRVPPQGFSISIKLPTLEPTSVPQNTARSCESIHSSASTSRLPRANTRYNIDLGSIQRNIDRLSMAEQTKSQALTATDLYRKAHPGLGDFTDPRQWYSTATTQKIMKKFSSNYQPTRTLPAHPDNTGPNTGQVAFYVTFPNIRKTEEKNIEFGSNAINKSPRVANNKQLPKIKHATRQKEKTEMGGSKSNIPIKTFTPNLQSKHSDQGISPYGSTESLDTVPSNITKRKEVQKHRSERSYSPDSRRKSSPIPRIEFTVPTARASARSSLVSHHIPRPPSSTTSSRQLAENVHEIVKSVTSQSRVGDDISNTTTRALQQPPSHSIELPDIQSNVEKNEVEQHQIAASAHGNLVKHSTMKKAFSHQNLRSIYTENSQPLEQTYMAKAESVESLLTETVGSRDKFMKLRLPKQRSEIDELHQFRDTYSLRQKSNLKLKNSVSAERRKSSSQSLITSRTTQDPTDVQSKLGPYLQGKIPDHYIVVPDSKGHGEAVGLPRKTPEPVRKRDESRDKADTSMSDAFKDVSSDAHTLGSGSVTQQHHARSRSLSEDITHPQRSTRSPKSKRLSIVPDDTQSLHTNPPPSQSSNVKQYVPTKHKQRTSKAKHLTISDSCLYKIGKDKTVLNLSLTQKDKPPTRKKNLIRAIDKYIQDKLGDKLKEQEELALKIVVQEHREKSNLESMFSHDKMSISRDNSMHPLLRENTRIKVKESDKSRLMNKNMKGKRAVFRRKQALTPFQERDRPKTKPPGDNIVYETYLDKKNYNPQLRPPTFRLDLRQYPPSRSKKSRDSSYDIKTNSIVEHGLERNLTEFSFNFPSPRAPAEEHQSDAANVMTHPENGACAVDPRVTAASKQPRHKRTPGNGGYVEFHIVGKSAEADNMQHSRERFDLDAYMASQHRYQEDREDSMDTGMMRDIYSNLDSYLGRMHQSRERDRDQLIVE